MSEIKYNTITKGIGLASVANIVCGFDVMGFAVAAPYDEIEITITKNAGVIHIQHTDAFNLPTNPKENIAGVALQALIDSYKHQRIGIDVRIHKNIKPGSGLGSSAASAAGVVAVANQALGLPFTKEQLIAFAMEGESLASGARHADNIAPCLYGGVTIVRSIDPVDIISIPAPELYVSIIHPQIEIKTSEARKILPTQISLKTASAQWANVAALVAGFLKNDYELIGRSMQDHIIEPIRSTLIPYFHELKTGSIQAGALGGGISGSGPSVFMLCQNEQIAYNVCQAMKQVYAPTQIPFNTYVTQIKNL